jgi:hypothetical protein
MKSIESYMSERSDKSVLTANHVKSLLVLRHMAGVSQSLVSGVLSIEAMLERHLFAAIGREVTVDDVTEYMKLRGQKMFQPEFRPSPMTYAIRRSSSHYLTIFQGEKWVVVRAITKSFGGQKDDAQIRTDTTPHEKSQRF